MSGPAKHAAVAVSAATRRIDAELRARGYAPLHGEQRAALFNQVDPSDAIGMLDDLAQRVRGITAATWRAAVEAVLHHATLDPVRRTFAEGCLLKAVNDVGLRMASGRPFYPSGPVPHTSLRDFVDLDDYCDANSLGGLTDPALVARGIALFGDDSAPRSVPGWRCMADSIRSAVGEWLAGAGLEMRSAEWVDRTEVTGQYRRAFPQFEALDDVPFGWWDSSDAADPCPSFRRGLYTLWIDHLDPELADQRTSMPRYALEIRDELGLHAGMVHQTSDWLEMRACLLTLPPSLDYLAMQSDMAWMPAGSRP